MNQKSKKSMRKLCSLAATVGIITAAMLAPFSARAAIDFNTFPISFTPQTNRDLPMIDAKNITRGGVFSTSQADHDNGVDAQPGDEIEFQIYYHNSGVPEEIATNVMIRGILPGGSRTTHEVSAVIDSDQTSPITSADAFRGGNIRIHVGNTPQTLEFLSGSTRHFPNRATTGSTLSDGNNITGNGVNIGSVRGCFEFSGFVTFRARVGSVTEDRGLTIDKKVLNITKSENTFRDSTSANPGDRLRFEIRFGTTGNASQNNVILRDILQTNLNFVPGSLRIDGSSVTSETDLFGSGRNFGTLPSNTSKVATFEVNVSGGGSFTGNTTLINTANVRSDEVGTKQDEATISVVVVLGTSFVQSKSAFNLTKNVDATSVAADPGDIIVYTLKFKNTGGATISGHVIEDNISDILELAEIVNQGGAVSVNGTIKYGPVDVTPGVEITRTFQVKVRAANLFPASSDLLMKNVFGNEVRVSVRKPQPPAQQPPRTGASEWLVAALAAGATGAYWAYRRKLSGNLNIGI